MIYDLYAELDSLQACPDECSLPGGLASGFVDGCTVWFARGDKEDKEKEEARQRYIRLASDGTLQLPGDLRLDGDLAAPLLSGWFAIEIRFKLLSPWYSKDDRSFHVLDNPVRKDRVFGVPLMSAASWKGLLRWSCRMQVGLAQHLEQHGGEMNGWSDPDWILHLFGNEKGEAEDFQRGAIAFYPTWFDRVGFEVINPHSRQTRAGTQPIVYEVVPPDTEGTLRLLYAPVPGVAVRDAAKPLKALQALLDAADQLLTVYGFSAKRTAGWGIAQITKARANGGEWKQESPIQELKGELGALLSSEAEKT